MQVIVDALRQCVTTSDRLVVVHSSLPHLVPPQSAGREEFLAAFGTLVASGMTVAFPAFTFAFCREGRFHFRKSLPETGILARWMLGMEGAIRTPHPIYSFVVVGPLAEELAAARNSTTFGDDSIFAAMERLDARLLMMGCDWSFCTQMHRYEEEARVPYRYFKQFPGVVEFSEGVVEEEAFTMFVRDLDIDPEISAEPAIRDLRNSGLIRTGRLWKGGIESVDCASFAEACRHALAADPWALVEARRDNSSSVAESDRASSRHMDGEIGTFIASVGFDPGDDREAMLDLDSYATMQLIVHLEQSFGIEVHAIDIVQENFTSVAAIARFVQSKHLASASRQSDHDDRSATRVDSQH